MEWITDSPEETIALGERLVREFPEVSVFGIQGPLGSGKTHLVKGMGLALGLPQNMIKSPTFLTLMEHEGVRPLFHFDFYRHENPEATLTEWWREHLDHPNALVVVEWPEYIPHAWPSRGAMRLQMESLGETKRRISVLPDRAQAEKLFEEFHTPMHVQAHCRQVGELAKKLAEGLKKVGIEVNPELAYLGGLIHDFVRVVDFKTLAQDLGTEEDRIFWRALREQYDGWHHADAGADILEKRGEGVLARIVKCHQFSALSNPNGPEAPQTWEEKLVYYADKRVKHDQIVPLEERLEEGWTRHFGDRPRTPEEESTRKAVFALEQTIFAHLAESERP